MWLIAPHASLPTSVPLLTGPPTEGCQRSNTQWEHTIRHTCSQLEVEQRAGRMEWEQGLRRHHGTPPRAEGLAVPHRGQKTPEGGAQEVSPQEGSRPAD